MSVDAPPLCRHGHGPKERRTYRSRSSGWAWFCRTCRNDQQRCRSPRRLASEARSRRRNLFIVALELHRRGGHCVHLGCDRADIQWHHRDPASKRFVISTGTRRSPRQLFAELLKCDPLCRPHHEEAHREIRRRIGPPLCPRHGTPKTPINHRSGKKNYRCRACANEWQRAYRARAAA